MESINNSRELVSSGVVRLYPKILSQIRRYVQDLDTALDIRSVVVIKVLQSYKLYDPSKNFDGWVYKITENAIFTELYRQKKKPTVLHSNGFDDDAISLSDGGGESYLIEERLDTEALRKIALSQQFSVNALDTLQLYNEGYKYAEISEILHIPLGTIKSKLNRARLKIRRGHEKQSVKRKN